LATTALSRVRRPPAKSEWQPTLLDSVEKARRKHAIGQFNIHRLPSILPPAWMPSNAIDYHEGRRRIALLRDQNKLIRDYQGSLLDTVYWALSGVFVLIAVLAGFGWWSNFKLYEADKNRLKEEFQSKFLELESRLALMIETNRGEIEKTLEARNEIHLNRFLSDVTDVRAQITTIRSDLNAQILSLRTQIDTNGKECEKAIRGVAEADASLRQVEEHIGDLRNVPQNILLTQGQGLTSAVEAKNVHQVKSALARMKITIAKKNIS
jgi:hypothetical protein